MALFVSVRVYVFLFTFLLATGLGNVCMWWYQTILGVKKKMTCVELDFQPAAFKVKAFTPAHQECGVRQQNTFQDPGVPARCTCSVKKRKWKESPVLHICVGIKIALKLLILCSHSEISVDLYFGAHVDLSNQQKEQVQLFKLTMTLFLCTVGVLLNQQAVVNGIQQLIILLVALQLTRAVC